MNIFDFILEVIFISVSGALSPGPLSAAVISDGMKKGWRSGFLASLGHMSVELPLVVLLSLGIINLLSISSVRFIIGLIGGCSLFVYALLQIFDAIDIYKHGIRDVKKRELSGFLIGFFLSLFNPFFLIWWATVGIKLVYDSLNVFEGNYVLGIWILYFSHVWIDFAWLSLLAYFGQRGITMSSKRMSFILIFFSMVMIYFGLQFIFSSLNFIV